VLPREFLPGRAALMIPQTDDGRVLFAVPWHDHVVVGTTDTPLDAPSLEPRALPDEIEFVMSHIGHYLTRTPQPSDVRSVFAGLRPLVKQGEGANTSRLARDHTIVVSSSGLLTVTGGKWTTYRKMAEDVVAQAETIAGLSPRECKTQQHPLHGATRDTIAEGNLRAYGSDAAAVRSTLAEAHGWKELLHPELSLQAGEVVWQTRHEMARTVEDVLARRTRMLLLHAHAAIDVAPRVASLMASELGRDADWERKQVQEFSDLARGYLLPE
jgi:glycerol-3-phosphate dehydrogenase